MRLRAYLTALLSVLICGTSAAASRHKTASCAFNDRFAREIISFKDCGWIDANGQAHIVPKYWKRIAFDPHGLASIALSGRWFWLDRRGRSAPTMAMDGWAEDFSDGLARSPRSGVGYMDRSLKLVIPARYDGALPFKKGVGEACKGCRLVHFGEHSSYQGGKWFCIDRRGREWRRNGANC